MGKTTRAWEQARKLCTTAIRLKGLLFQKLCERACQDGLAIFEQVKQNPHSI